MTDANVVEALVAKLAIPTGRHLYGVVGSYTALDRFKRALSDAAFPNGQKIQAPVSVTNAVLSGIEDEEFRRIVADEAKRPEVVATEVQRVFEAFLREQTRRHELMVLANIEVVFAYHLELNLLRTLAADDVRILVLLPGRISNGKVLLFTEQPETQYTLPTNLIAENHLWEVGA